MDSLDSFQMELSQPRGNAMSEINVKGILQVTNYHIHTRILDVQSVAGQGDEMPSIPQHKPCKTTGSTALLANMMYVISYPF